MPRLISTVLHHILFYFSLCLASRDKTLTFILGTQDSAKWDAGAGPGTNPTIAYNYGEKQVSVELVCSENTTAEFEAIGENPINNFKFRLTHKCACWDGCKCKLFFKILIYFCLS